MTDDPVAVLRAGLEDREWDCMCDPGSHEDPCPFAALDTLVARLKEAEAQLERQEADSDRLFQAVFDARYATNEERVWEILDAALSIPPNQEEARKR